MDLKGSKTELQEMKKNMQLYGLKNYMEENMQTL